MDAALEASPNVGEGPKTLAVGPAAVGLVARSAGRRSGWRHCPVPSNRAFHHRLSHEQ